MEVGFLADFVHLTESLGVAIYYEWESMYLYQGKTLNDVVATIGSRAVKNTIPLTMIAHENGDLRGSVTLKVSEGDDYQECSPWLAGVFVLPEFRGLGIGKMLINFAEQVAVEKFGVTRLFLYSSTAQELYRKLGYRTISLREKDGKIVEYMAKEFT